MNRRTYLGLAILWFLFGMMNDLMLKDPLPGLVVLVFGMLTGLNLGFAAHDHATRRRP